MNTELTRGNCILARRAVGRVGKRRKKLCKTDNFSVTAEVFECSAGQSGIIFRNSEGEAVCTFTDVCVDYLWAKSFCDRCNLYGLSQEHIMDVLEDSLP